MVVGIPTGVWLTQFGHEMFHSYPAVYLAMCKALSRVEIPIRVARPTHRQLHSPNQNRISAVRSDTLYHIYWSTLTAWE